MRLHTLLIGVLLFCFSATAFGYEETRSLTLSAAEVSELEIYCGAGYLRVTGHDNLQEIRVNAEIIIDRVSKSRAKNIIQNDLRLTLNRQGNKAVLTSEHERRSGIFGRDYSVRVNLTVEVPKNIHLMMEDGSGEIAIRNIDGNLGIDDGSGEIEVEDIRGYVRIHDGSGELTLTNIGGNTEIDDGSGRIEAEGVHGDIRVNDGSGTLRISQVTGTVRVDDGSGDIRISDVGGDVQIIDDGSGGVRLHNVNGSVTRGNERSENARIY